MKIGELNQHCGDCPIIEFCGNPFGFCVCSIDSFKDVETERYKEIANNAETVTYCECVGCDDDNCDGCPCDDESRDYFCEQIANEVKKVINLN